MQPSITPDFFRILFETIPIALGIYVLFLLWMTAPAHQHRGQAVLAIRAAIYASIILLFVAQSSWMMSVLRGSQYGTWLADILWTLFDALVVGLLITWIRRGIR